MENQEDSKLVSYTLDLSHFHSLLEIADHAQSIPKVIDHLMEKPETISELDFLKQDIYSSPKFMYDPGK